MNVEAEIAVLKSDVNRMASLFEKLDTAIERMGDVSNNIARMLAVHEERITRQEFLDEEIHTLVEKRKQELQGDIKELHSRITTTTRELSEDINDIEQRIMSAMTYGMADIKKCITEENKILAEQLKVQEKRITELERWKWFIMGGSIAVGAFAHEIVGYLLH